MKTEFFMAMIPPTVTHQEKDIKVVNGKPIVYEPDNLKAARSKIESHLAVYRPNSPYMVAVQLVTKWCFPVTGRHRSGDYKTTRPDTDNLQKMLKDCMTRLGYWKDDALVASEITEKFWSNVPGIFISIRPLTKSGSTGGINNGL